MKQREFSETIGRLQQKADELSRLFHSRRRAAGPLDQVFMELSNGLEELRVAEEELRERDEALATLGHALEDERQRYQDLFDLAPDAYVVTDRNGIILEANRAAVEMCGTRSGLLVGTPLQLLYGGKHQKTCRDRLQELRSGGTVRHWEAVFQARRGRGAIATTANASARRDAAGRVIGFLWLLRDVTEWLRIREKLSGYEEQLRSLAYQALVAEERERHRLAEALHDGLNQSLALAKIKLGMLREAAADRRMDLPISDIAKLVDDAERQARSLVFELSPPVLHDLGLEPAAQWLAEDLQKRHGLDVSLVCRGSPESLDERIRILLFRSLRELLVNVVKHAEADHARVSIRRDRKSVSVVVQDAGRGFVPSVIDTPSSTSGFGLRSIREHLAAVGGRMEIRSAPGRGTRVSLAAPLSTEED